jgi:two-component system, OmpR family, alkaline phosphatase synthesis response regulator PhoP
MQERTPDATGEMTIVLADDHTIVRSGLRLLLEAEDGLRVVAEAGDVPEAVRKVRAYKPDVLVLDLGLPGMDGLDVARALRRESDIPIVMLTARDDELDRVLGLEIGADDYVTKPFSPRELVARIRAILRRVDRVSEGGDRVEAAGVSIDVARMRVEAEGRVVELTPTEFQLLLTLARQPGRIFTRSQLLDSIHGLAFESYERAIDAHVKNLRRKLESDPSRPKFVLTVYGVGYRFAEDAP